MESKTIYFGYGSNIWLDQMRQRCPKSQFMGIAILSGWKWIITTRGYANLIPSEEDIVYGFVYELSEADGHTLDWIESSYDKEYMPVEFLAIKDSDNKSTITALVYVESERKEIGEPKEEYVGRMNKAVEDGLKEGIPMGYINKYIRPFIPEREHQRLH